MKTLTVNLTQLKNKFEPLTETQKKHNKEPKNKNNKWERSIVGVDTVINSFSIEFDKDTPNKQIEGALCFSLMQRFLNKNKVNSFSFAKKFNIEIVSINGGLNKTAKSNQTISLTEKNIPEFMYNFVQTIQTALIVTDNIFTDANEGLKLALEQQKQKVIELQNVQMLIDNV